MLNVPTEWSEIPAGRAGAGAGPPQHHPGPHRALTYHRPSLLR